ncbi:MAG: CCA tRNA nucleotidyltransferase [bacterium]
MNRDTEKKKDKAPQTKPSPVIPKRQAHPGSVLDQIHRAAEEVHARVYLVGGWVRNYVLNRLSLDIDLLVYGDPGFLSSLRTRIPSTLICLDKERSIHRLALQGSPATIDVAFEKESVSLEQNLGERDFTINAMAVKSDDAALRDGFAEGLLIDPFHGREDVERGIIRMVREENFLLDPLRLCRAFRFGAEFGFAIGGETLGAITRHATLIGSVSPERIREEWVKMMGCPRTAPYVKKMQETGLLGEILPEIRPMEGLDQGPRHALCLWEHSWETLHILEEMMHDPDAFLPPVCAKLVHSFTHEQADQVPCLRMAALLHDIGKPEVAGTGKQGQITFYGHQKRGAKILGKRMDALRFSRAEIRLTTRLVENHMRPLLLSLAPKASDRAKVRLFIRLGDTWQAVLLLSLADVFATVRDPQGRNTYAGFVASLLHLKGEIAQREKKAPLVTGDDLQRELLFPPGPLMGKALAAINQSHLCGAITTQEEALAMARTFLTKTKTGSV